MESRQFLPNAHRWRWVFPTACALLLLGIDLLLAQVIHPGLPAKGSVARTTIRAATDAVFDLRQTHSEEAAARRRDYVPIYDKDNKLLYRTRERIVVAARRQAADYWRFAAPPAKDDASAADSSADADRPDDARPVDALGDRGKVDRQVSTPPPGKDAGIVDARSNSTRAAQRADAAAQTEESVAASAAELNRERARELESLIRGVFRLLEPFYKEGVVADNEFPVRKRRVRVYTVVRRSPRARATKRYVVRTVGKLRRFSRLRPVLERSAAQFFYKTDADTRHRVLDFVFARLAPNMSYAAENKRVIDISEVTGVKVVLIRKGEVLARRGQVIDTRAYYAIRASVTAASQVAPLERTLGQAVLLLSILMLFAVAAKDVSPMVVAELRPQFVLYGGVLVLAAMSSVALAIWPIHSVLLPQAAAAMIAAVLFGRMSAMSYGVIVTSILGVMGILDVAAVVVGLAGSLSAALVSRRRQRARVLPVAVIVGLVQSLAYEATRAQTGTPQTSAELLNAAQAFFGGIGSGVLAALVLPFLQRWLGQSSRGKLEVLGDFDHPLARRLRERRPEVFAHSVRVVNLADCAADAIGADRLLTRCGALYHDIGKITLADQPQETIEQRARAARLHLARGLELAAEQRFPGELKKLLAEHHGTLEMSELIEETQHDGAEVDLGRLSYVGPKPSCPESAVLLIANAIEIASRGVSAKRAGVLVGSVLGAMMLQVQFDRCGLTQGELQRVRQALVQYLASNSD